MPHLDRWQTSITEIGDGVIRYRGQDIAPLIDEGDLTDCLWLLLFGYAPNDGQADAFRRAVIAALDHGPAAPSTLAARATASTRSSIPFSLAAGLIAFAGPAHGGAAEEAAKIFAETAGSPEPMAEVGRHVDHILSSGRRMPGYGHPYHSVDPRVAPLMAGIAEQRIHRDLALAFERVLTERTGKSLRMNADAAVGALLLDAGLLPSDVTLVTALGRSFGLASHAREEQLNERPFRAPALATIHFQLGEETETDPEVDR